MEMMESIKKVDCDKFPLYICLSKPLGRGISGSVFEALRGDRPDEVIVVKIIENVASMKTVLENELNVFKSLPSHPNIVKSDCHYLKSEQNYYLLM
jgi:hypothetical protein